MDLPTPDPNPVPCILTSTLPPISSSLSQFASRVNPFQNWEGTQSYTLRRDEDQLALFMELLGRMPRRQAAAGKCALALPQLIRVRTLHGSSRAWHLNKSLAPSGMRLEQDACSAHLCLGCSPEVL